MKWNEMSQEVKQHYQQLASQLPSPSDNLFSYTVITTHYVLPQLFIIRSVNRPYNARHSTNMRVTTYLVVHLGHESYRIIANTILSHFLEIGYVHVGLAELNTSD